MKRGNFFVTMLQGNICTGYKGIVSCLLSLQSGNHGICDVHEWSPWTKNVLLKPNIIIFSVRTQQQHQPPKFFTNTKTVSQEAAPATNIFHAFLVRTGGSWTMSGSSGSGGSKRCLAPWNVCFFCLLSHTEHLARLSCLLQRLLQYRAWNSQYTTSILVNMDCC